MATYTVKPGDSLSSIAEAHNQAVSDLEAANPHIKNLHLIYPGQEINLAGGSDQPAQAPTESHHIDAGIAAAPPPAPAAPVQPVGSQFQQMAVQIQQEAEGFPKMSSYGAMSAPVEATPLKDNQGGAAGPPPSDVTNKIGLITNSEDHK